MAQPLTVTLPPNIYPYGDCIVRVAAINPADGSIVSGVNVQNVAMQVELVQGSVSDLVSGTFKPILVRKQA